MRITATDYSQHILLEMRRPDSAPPISTISTKYVSHLATALPRLTCKTPLVLNDAALQLDPTFVDALFADAVISAAARGYDVTLADVVSLYHQQTGELLTPATKHGIYLDHWALCPARVAVDRRYVVKMTARQWELTLGPFPVAEFCIRYLSGLSAVRDCTHLAQLSKRLCLVVLPLTTFRIPNAVRCDITHQAIHRVDRITRSMVAAYDTSFTL